MKSLRKEKKWCNYIKNKALLNYENFLKDKKSSLIIDFYLDKYSIEEKKGYFFTDIIKKWTDYDLEISHGYIEWIFPSKDKFNDKYPSLNLETIQKFKKNKKLREKVVEAFLRMLLFFGFSLEKKENSIKRVKPINRKRFGIVIGLLSCRSYNKISRIMKFLKDIDMAILALILLGLICYAMEDSSVLKNKIIKNNFLTEWASIVKVKYTTDKIKKFRKNILVDNIQGLSYYGTNSCYLDSVLIALFLFPSHVIKNNILKKNLNILKNKKLWSRCSKNIDKDIKIRYKIQKELNFIYRNFLKKNSYNVSNLRKLLKDCPGSQNFHGNETQDAGEFLSYLFGIFQIDVAQIKLVHWGKNKNSQKWKKVRTIVDPNSSPIIDIPSHYLIDKKDNYNITNFIEQKNFNIFDTKNIWIPNKNSPQIQYKFKKTVKKVYSPFIIFKIDRTQYNNKNLWKKIWAPKNFTFRSKTYQLKSIVIHTGGSHYISVVSNGIKWFYFDDTDNSEIYEIGNYETMLTVKPSPLTHGTIFIYD